MRRFHGHLHRGLSPRLDSCDCADTGRHSPFVNSRHDFGCAGQVKNRAASDLLQFLIFSQAFLDSVSIQMHAARGR